MADFMSTSLAASGDIIPAIEGSKIRVLAIAIIGSGTAVDLCITSGTSTRSMLGDATNKVPIDKSGAAGSPSIVLPYNPAAWFETRAGESLYCTLSTTQAVVFNVVYAHQAAGS